MNKTIKTKVTPPYRTVITLQDLEFGGTQRYAIHLLTHLNRDLFKLELWVLRGGGEDMLPMAESCGVPVTYLSLLSDSVRFLILHGQVFIVSVFRTRIVIRN